MLIENWHRLPTEFKSVPWIRVVKGGRSETLLRVHNDFDDFLGASDHPPNMSPKKGFIPSIFVASLLESRFSNPNYDALADFFLYTAEPLERVKNKHSQVPREHI